METIPEHVLIPDVRHPCSIVERGRITKIVIANSRLGHIIELDNATSAGSVKRLEDQDVEDENVHDSSQGPADYDGVFGEGDCGALWLQLSVGHILSPAA